jgi:HEPN domain-containing protein
VSPEIPREWFALAEQNVRMARLALEQDVGCEAAAFQIHEAAEKALKGYLITAGWELSKTHVLPSLVGEARRREPRFGAYVGLCGRIDGFLLVRYPPFPEAPATSSEMLADLAEVEALIKLARQVVKETLG